MEGTIEKTKGKKKWISKKARNFNQNWSSETEVHDMLYGLIKALKPEKVLEIGTFEGDTALAIAKALQDNKLGHLTTIDINDFGQEKFLSDNGVATFVTCIKQEALGYTNTLPAGSFDFIFIDGCHNFKYIASDLESAGRLLKVSGYMLGHDVIMIPDVASAYKNFIDKNSNNYQHMILDTYAGVFILKKIYG